MMAIGNGFPYWINYHVQINIVIDIDHRKDVLDSNPSFDSSSKYIDSMRILIMLIMLIMLKHYKRVVL